MEALTLFAATVGTIGVLHILFSAEEMFTEGRYSKGNTKAKRQDWYCFFEPSDLVGSIPDPTTQPQVRDDRNIDQRRRQQANRPRLRV